MYEYNTLCGSIEVIPNIYNNQSEKAIGTQMTKELGKIVSEFPAKSEKMDGGGWEIFSHNLLLLGNHLVISLLLRRPLQKKRG